MPIKVTCTHCGVTLSTPDSAAGKTGKCPKCSKPIQIPALQAPKEEVLEAESSIFDGLDEAALTAGVVSEDQRRPCPACGELIMRGAVKCRYCDEIFDPSLKKRDKKVRAKQARKSGTTGDAEMSTGDWVVALICSGIGCLAGIIWMIQGKPKGTKMVMISFGMVVFWNLFVAAIKTLTEQQ